MTDLAIYGNIVLQTDVEQAVMAILEERLEEYVARMERHTKREPRSVELPQSFITRNDLDHWPQEMLPSVVVTCPGSDPNSVRRYGDGTYSLKWMVGVGVVVGADTKPNADALAKFYGGAVRECLVQNGSLEGFADATDWEYGKTDDLANTDELNLSASSEIFTVETHNAVNAAGGNAEAPEEPYEEPSDPGEFETHKESVSMKGNEDGA